LFTESARSVYTGEPINFNAANSFDPDGYIVDYFWDFGDGSNATGVVVNHAYVENGIYTVTLTVTDNENKTGSATTTITVLNRLSIPSFTESAETVYTGEVIFFDASGSYDPDGSIVSYQWNFGDGTNAAGITANHSYADDGIYAVRLTVTDDDGATASTTAVKTVLNRLPVASFTESAETINIGETITFNASESYDSDGYIVDYFWDFGEGSNATGVVVSHAYSYNGTYTVTLTVTDDDGATASTTAIMTVLDSTATSLTEFLSVNNSVCTVRSTVDYGTPKTMALTSGARKDLSNDVGESK
jgi:PKD repeat protein